MAPTPEADWRSTVHVERDLELEAELARRHDAPPPPRTVSVTDLLDVRSAFYRHLAPVEVSPERAARMDAGRELHESLGSAIAEAPHLEVRVRRDGIVGQIDLFDERPTEIKTAASFLEPDELRTLRPSYFEQLGLYCAMVDRTGGRLLVAAHAEPFDLRILEVEFSDLRSILEEAHDRAARLRAALSTRSPAGLPACGWRGRGCEYELHAVCACDGTEPRPVYPIADRAKSIRRNPGAEQRLRDLVGSHPHPAAGPRRFRDLLFPRRAFFERTSPPVEAGAAVPRGPERDDLYRSLSDLLESGPAGEFTREPGNIGPAREKVSCFRGAPVLLKVSRSWSVPAWEKHLADQPHYFLDLALRCGSVDNPEGRLVLGYERHDRWADRVRAYRIRYEPLSEVQRVGSSRAAALSEALRTGDPSGLPACPSWMFTNCAFRERCGCGPSAPGPDSTGR